MPRSRNIKPSFFKNEILAELPFETRLLFIGLWTLADREGRLEDRVKRIKMELFPVDNVDIDTMLQMLHHNNFIQRYDICPGQPEASPRLQKSKYIQIVNFKKHQSPHHREADSTIPAPGQPQASLGKALLIPDSLNLIPDSLNTSIKIDEHAFEDFWNKFPNKVHKQDALSAYDKTIEEGIKHEIIISKIPEYEKHCKVTNRKMVDPATWINKQGWTSEWKLPEQQTEQQYREEGEEKKINKKDFMLFEDLEKEALKVIEMNENARKTGIRNQQNTPSFRQQCILKTHESLSNKERRIGCEIRIVFK